MANNGSYGACNSGIHERLTSEIPGPTKHVISHPGVVIGILDGGDRSNVLIYIYIWVFPKIGVPKNGWFIMVPTLLKWMIWGYPY